MKTGAKRNGEKKWNKRFIWNSHVVQIWHSRVFCEIWQKLLELFWHFLFQVLGNDSRHFWKNGTVWLAPWDLKKMKWVIWLFGFQMQENSIMLVLKSLFKIGFRQFFIEYLFWPPMMSWEINLNRPNMKLLS